MASQINPKTGSPLSTVGTQAASSGGAITATITGTGVVGSPLTAKLPDGYVGTLQFTRSTKATTPVKTLISGAVANAVNSLAYTPVSGDTAYNIGCDTSNVVAPSATVSISVAGSSDVAPAVVSAPVILGTPTEGVAVAATAGVFTGSPTPTVVRSWLVAGTVVATASTYTPVAGDAGKLLTVREVASNTVNGSPASVTSTSAAVNIAAAEVVSTAYDRIAQGMQRVAAGMDYTKIAFEGDSTVAGAASRGAGQAIADNRVVSPTVLLTNKLNALQPSLPAICSGFFGDQRFGATNATAINVYDPRVTFPDGANAWVASTGGKTIGGSMMNANTNSFRLGFLPETAVDRFEVVYSVSSSAVAFTVSRTGSTSITPNTVSATAAMRKAIFTGPLGGTDPVFLARNSGNLFVASVDAWNSAIKSIRVSNLGWSGGKIADWVDATAPASPLNSIQAHGADLHLLRSGTNDIVAATSIATYEASLGVWYDVCLTVGDVIALTHFPINTTVVSAATQQLYVDALKRAAASRNITVHDTYANFGSWAAANTAGYMADNLHPLQAGYQADVDVLAPLILSLKSAARISPLIVQPFIIGSPAAYNLPEAVASQQWALDGTPVAGATGSTYTQAFADSAKALTVTAVTTAGRSTTSKRALPGVRNLKLSNSTKLRAMLASGDGLWLGCGDSGMSGYFAGGNGETNMRANSYLAKLVAGLNGAGFKASKDSSFGTGRFSNSTTALFSAMDPRWSFVGSGQTILSPASFLSYGGGMLGMAVPADSGAATASDRSTFTPGTPFDTIDVYVALNTNAPGTYNVSVDGGTTILGTIVCAAATPGVGKFTFTAPSGSTAVTFSVVPGSGTAAPYIDGVETRVAASPRIRIIDGALTGTRVQENATTPTTTAATAFVPRAVMTQLAAGVTNGVLVLNGWYNDQSAGQNLNQICNSYRILCDEARSRGFDIMYVGYPALDTASISKANFDLFEDGVTTFLADVYDAIIVQSSKILTDYTTYNALGYYGDGIHSNGLGKQKDADTLLSVCKIASTLVA